MAKTRIIKITEPNNNVYFIVKFKWLWFWITQGGEYGGFQFGTYDEALKYITILSKSNTEEIVYEH